MPRFFCEEPPQGAAATLTGEDAQHIVKVLRMAPGEALTLCDGKGTDYACVVETLERDRVTLRVLGSEPSQTEPTLRVRLYQGLPKGDKFELIVQKAVELGVAEIVPVLTHRCVSRPDGASLEKKLVRWQRVAYEAAKQSMRGRVPAILPPVEYRKAVEEMAESVGEGGRAILFYERSQAPLSRLLADCPQHLSILVGPEGGFEESEVALAQEKGVAVATLGRRILRCETAPLAALAAAMYATGNMD